VADTFTRGAALLLWRTSAVQVREGPGDGKVVVYLHGGGFVACNSEVLIHSLPTPMARSGFRVFSIDYALASGPRSTFQNGASY
jgi:acetyl esterase/lipase